MAKGGHEAGREAGVQKTSETKCRVAHQRFSGATALPELADELSKVAEVVAQGSGYGDEPEPENWAHDPAVQAQLS
jgi:hypothetical protein